MRLQVGKERLFSKDFTGRTDVIRWDVINVQLVQMLKMTFVSTSSPSKQGIRLAVDVGKGQIEVNSVSSKAIELWEHTAPREVICKCISPQCLLSIYNIWEREGMRESQMYGSGMLIEEEDNKRTYHCNDYGLDTQFDKLVFTLELL